MFSLIKRNIQRNLTLLPIAVVSALTSILDTKGYSKLIYKNEVQKRLTSPGFSKIVLFASSVRIIRMQDQTEMKLTGERRCNTSSASFRLRLRYRENSQYLKYQN